MDTFNDNEKDENVNQLSEDDNKQKDENSNNFDDLEKQKFTEKENVFNAEDNIAQSQTFIQDMRNITINNYIQETGKKIPKSSDEKNYDLTKPEDCTEFVEKYKDSDYLAVAIIISVFELVALSDLSELKSKLLESLPNSNSLNNDNFTNGIKFQDSYISLTTILYVIGGNKYIAKDGQQCIGFGNKSIQILTNFYELFPGLRHAIVDWLLKLSTTYKYKNNFDTYQMAYAFAMIASIDFIDAQKQIFPILYTNPSNANLLGTILFIICKNNCNLSKEVQKVIDKLLQSDSGWLWRPAFVSYALFAENNLQFNKTYELKIAIEKRITFFKRNDLIFILTLAVQSQHLRDLISDIFKKSYNNAQTKEKKNVIVQMYLNLVRYDYFFINKSHKSLILVACDTLEQQQNITELLREIMFEYNLRKKLYSILQAYLKELSYYDYSKKLINHISAFFYTLSLSGKHYKTDILLFLQQCDNKAAAQVYKLIS